MTVPTTTAWTALTVRLAPAADAVSLDLASGALFELGAGGLEQRDGPPLELVASFPATETPEALIGRALAAFGRLGLTIDDLSVSAWPDVDWSTHWRRHFRALSFGRVWVVPNWLEPPPEAEVVLRIDPGMAFGTGLHPTTSLCLERIVELSPIGTLLDVGTGTGILALAAAALGARAVATDNDPVAVALAVDNAAANGLSDRVSVHLDAAVAIDGEYAVVVANVLAEPLIALASPISARVAPGGRLILSGLMASQAEAVAAAYRAQGLSTPTVRRRDEWVSLELTRVG